MTAYLSPESPDSIAFQKKRELIICRKLYLVKGFLASTSKYGH